MQSRGPGRQRDGVPPAAPGGDLLFERVDHGAQRSDPAGADRFDDQLEIAPE